VVYKYIGTLDTQTDWKMKSYVESKLNRTLAKHDEWFELRSAGT